MRAPLTIGGLFLLSILGGCVSSPSTPAYAPLSAEQAAANRMAINQIEDEDRARDHVERMREVEAIERINRSLPSQTTVVY
ncbi:MAG: hypothetical protein WBP46_15585 [Thiolinea sp.]